MVGQRARIWLSRQGVGPLIIEAGSPWENGYIESFIGNLQDEFMNREIFYMLDEATILIELSPALPWSKTTKWFGLPAPETIAFQAGVCNVLVVP